jgi:hypothetical protein
LDAKSNKVTISLLSFQIIKSTGPSRAVFLLVEKA